MALSTLTTEAVEAEVEARIDAALTADVLSRLAFKGVTPNQAREYLRKRVALGIVKAFA